MKSASRSVGLIEALIASFEESLRVAEGEAKPIVLLWTDTESQWRELIPSLQTAVTKLYVLGPYDPAKRTGPAIWLKCVVDRALPEVAPPENTIPILYLPDVSRQELRAGTDCRPAWQSLIELQYRGRVWHQPNGRDWSVEAFLVSDTGLRLDVAQDGRTLEAMRRALPLLAEASIEGLRGHRLDADDFDKLAVSDPVRDLLRWMSNPEAFRKTLDVGRWQSFCNVSKSEFNVAPDDDGPSTAANLLITGGGRWEDVWQRFCEAPRLYPGISELLREPRPGQAKLAFEQPRNPVANEAAESQLRSQLEATTSLPHYKACERIAALEAEHGRRRDWVWAQLGESTFAMALEPLFRLATLAKSALGGTNVEVIADAYAADGWRCDKAALDALSISNSGAESALISKVVATLYTPWLDASARRLQEVFSQSGGDLRKLTRGVEGEADTCIVFVDGLRFDLGGLLREKLELRSAKVLLSHRIAPIPTVTGTAKPLASPAYRLIEGPGQADDFTPVIIASKQPVTASRLRDEIARMEIEVLDADELKIAGTAKGGGWTEIGRLDELGHKLGTGLAAQTEHEIERIANRVISLLESGWRRIHIVTDHGWLLMPGGLPKVELPAYLVATKWARCAVVRGEAAPAVPIFPWHWNSQIRIASPPGIACFSMGYEYAHGGISPQECVVPDLMVERGTSAVKAEIDGITWRGMRCRVTVRSNTSGVRVDLRLNWKRPDTSIVAAAKEVGPDGEASVVVEKDMHEGASATVVALDPAGNVLDRKITTVGEA